MNHTGKTPFPEAGHAPQRLADDLAQNDAADVALWRVTLSQPAEALAVMTPWLSATEALRAARMTTPALHRRAVAIRAQLRWLLAAALDVSPAALAFDSGPHGRPLLAPPFANGRVVDFNLSHSGEAMLVGIVHAPDAFAATPRRRRIGVDLETALRPRDTDRLALRVLTERERDTLQELDAPEQLNRFLHYWTLKEAFSKAVGLGFSIGFQQLDFDVAVPPRACPPVVRALPEPYRPSDWRLHFVDFSTSSASPPCIAAVALER